MNKILKILFIFFSIFVFIKKSYAESVNINIEPISDVQMFLKTDDKILNIDLYKYIYKKENLLVYSLIPNKEINNEVFHTFVDVKNSNINITDDEWKYITYVMFYGYNYKDRTDLRWYLATQIIIWEYFLNEHEELYFIDENNNRIDLYKEEIETIKKDVENMYILPSFLNSFYDIKNPNFEIKLYEDLVLEDKNNVLDLYTPVFSNDISYAIQDSKLKLNFNKAGDYLIRFYKNDGESLRLPKILSNNTKSYRIF